MNSVNSDPKELTEEQSRALISKISWRLIPLLFICYIVAYIDRINIGFAKLQLQEVLGVDEKIFWQCIRSGSRAFLYWLLLFEVPSNLILQRVGARLWIARIMIVWGLVTMFTMFIGNTTSFYFIRFLLGAVEAGFYRE